MNKRAFAKNTAVLTATSLLLRLFGILFRIFVSNRVGAEGMGLYQLVFSVYLLGTAFAGAGLTTAVARLCAEHIAKGHTENAKRVLYGAITLAVGIGILSAAGIALGAPAIGRLLGDERATGALRISGLGLPMAGISACLRGWFLARRNAAPTATGQMTEQVVRIASILLLLRRKGSSSIPTACRMILWGDVLAEGMGAVWLMLAYGRDQKRLPASKAAKKAPVWKPLLTIACPLTAGRYLATGLHTAENALVPWRLSLFTGSAAVALAQFGAIKGMVLPVLFFPAAFVLTVAGLLVPELSDAAALGQTRQVARITRSALSLAWPVGLWLGGLFALLGRPLGVFLYHSDEVGLYMQILGPLTPVMILDSVCSALLKGLNQQMHALWFGVVDSAVRIAMIWVLLPRFGITGFLFVMLVSNLLTAWLSFQRLHTVSGVHLRPGKVLLPPLLTVLSAGGGAWMQSVLPDGIGYSLLVGGGVSAVYFALLLLLGVWSVPCEKVIKKPLGC